jgi:alginate O-acetyltransferase complex protein AlgI
MFSPHESHLIGQAVGESVNYNTLPFWVLFLAVILPYWRLSHRGQNRLLLVASYVFYGVWDYRFLTLVFVATAIDYVGGLGVAGIQLSKRRLFMIAGMIVAGVSLLCSHIQYAQLIKSIWQCSSSGVWNALPRELSDWYVVIGTLGGCLAYVALVSGLYCLSDARRRKWFVAVSMIANLAILGFFKYWDFFIGNLDELLNQVGLGCLGGTALRIILPPGISFYTFQAMSYTIDIYRGEAKPTKSLSDFALFVCFFPHLVAGPIMRASTLLPQVVRPRSARPAAFEEGLLLILIGLFKKMVIADNMAPIVNSVFCRYLDGTSGSLTGADVLVAVYAFAFQIYGDFSGYSSIARGISKWLGFELVINFWTPYLAVGPSDFWRRWHISLSSWLRDYLYIPLGGSRYGTYKTYRNLTVTMFLGGLWHGASWTFVIWGLYHGALLCIFRALGIRDPGREGSLRQRAYWLLRVLLMFHLTCFGWLLFRADNFTELAAMIQSLATNFVWTSHATSMLCMVLFYCAVPFVVEFLLDGENKIEQLAQAHWAVCGPTYAYLTVMLLFFHASQTYEFIYFQF